MSWIRAFSYNDILSEIIVSKYRIEFVYLCVCVRVCERVGLFVFVCGLRSCVSVDTDAACGLRCCMWAEALRVG